LRLIVNTRHIFFMLALASALGVLSFTGRTLAQVATYPLTYAARLTDSGGAPLEGAVDAELRFWSDAVGGTQLAETFEYKAVILTQGVLQLRIPVTGDQIERIFADGSEPVFVEITAAGKSYPRQEFSYVPLAIRVPVDNATLAFRSDGKLAANLPIRPGSNTFLTVDSAGKFAWETPVVTTLRSQNIATTVPATGQLLSFDGGQWTPKSLMQLMSAGTGISLSNAGGTVTIGTTDGGAPKLAKSGDTMTGRLSLPADGLSVGDNQLMLASGNVGIGSTSPGAKLDIVGQVKIQGGSPGPGKVLTSDADGLASWSTPAGHNSISIGTGEGLAGGPITNSGTITLADTNVSPGNYNRANFTVDQKGRIVSAANGAPITDADIDGSANVAQSKISGLTTALNAKETAIAAGTNFQYWRGDKTWQTLNTDVVAEGTKQYFTVARAKEAFTASAPISYSNTTGDISIAQASATGGGYLSAADWVQFNAKQTSLGFMPVNKAGDTVNGPLDLTSNNLTNVGNILMSGSKLMGFSHHTSDPVLSGPADQGKFWYNSTSNLLKYWDGASVKTLSTAGATDWMSPGAIGAGTPNSGAFTSLTASGNVGIGTTAPTSQFEVNGLISVVNEADNPYARSLNFFKRGVTGDATAAVASGSELGYTGFYGWDGNAYVRGAWLGAVSSQAFTTTARGTNLIFVTTSDNSTGNAERMRVTANGNVGIGTTNPAGRLDVAGSLCLNGTNCITSWPNAGGYWATSGGDSYVASGKLGVGTASPSADLSFGGSIARTIQVDRNSGAGTNGGGLTLQAGGAISGGSNYNGGNLTLASGVATGTGTSSIEFKTSGPGASGASDAAPTTKMTILGNGNVGIGTTAPVNTLQLGNLIDSASATPLSLSLGGTYSAAAGANPKLKLYESSGAHFGFGISPFQLEAMVPAGSRFAWFIGGNEKLRLDTNGNLGIGTNNPGHLLQSGSGAADSQMVAVRGYATGTNWKGGGAFGFSSGNVIMGELNGVAQIGGHTGNLGAWANLALNTGGGNVGIGSEAPTEKLDVAGSVNIAGGGRIFMGSAGVAAPGAGSVGQKLQLWGTPGSVSASDYSLGIENSHMWFNTGGGFKWYVGSALKSVMDSNGNVGIGVNSPGTKLDVDGAIRSTGEIIGTMSGGGAGQSRFVYGNYGLINRNDGTNYFMLLTAAGDPYGTWNSIRPFTINLATGDTTINGVTSRASGNVEFSGAQVATGVGVIRDSGGGWLRTYGDTGWYSQTYGGGWHMTDSTWLRAYGGKNIYTPSVVQGDAAVQSGLLYSWGNARVDGSLGLGTNAPATKLELVQGVSNHVGGIRIRGADFGTGTVDMWEQGPGYGQNFYIQPFTGNTTSIEQGYGNTVLNPWGGNVGIGNSNPSTPLFVSGSVANGAATFISNTGNTANSHGLQVQGGSQWGGGYIQIFYRGGDGAFVGSINQSSASSVAFNTTSDKRLKENVVDTSLGLDLLTKVKVRDYNYIDDPSKRTLQGFIAQELYDVYPQAVTVGGDDPKIKPWQVDYAKLTPVLVKSVQQLNTESQQKDSEIRNLKARAEIAEQELEALKAETAALKTLFCQQVKDAPLCNQDDR